MKLHYEGTSLDLEHLVQSLGFRGVWQVEGDGLRFTTEDKGIILWYGRRIGTVLFQGREAARNRLQDLLTQHFGGPVAIAPAA
jgi:hypothetical protein